MADSSPPPPPDDFTDWYNSLLLIDEADRILQAAGGLAILQKIAGIIWAPNTPPSRRRFALSITHRHHTLYSGERMVATGSVTEPSIDTDPRIVPSAWTAAGRPYEWQRVADPYSPDVQPPEKEITDELQEIVGLLGSLGQALGLSLAPPEGPEGHIWWEEIIKAKRQHISTTRPPVALPQTWYETAWVMRDTKVGYVMACCSMCPNHGGGIN
jgi:hypothetical protein